MKFEIVSDERSAEKPTAKGIREPSLICPPQKETPSSKETLVLPEQDTIISGIIALNTILFAFILQR